jgi:REP element-mobilizing transposase RayT
MPGGIYHVSARGNNRQPIFIDDRDRRLYLLILGDVTAEFGWIRLGHCLMDNHVHLILETPEANLSDGMHRLQMRYTRRFNHRHERTGHLFGSRFNSVRVVSDRQLVAATEYVLANPVKAGLCEQPESWPWTDCEAARRRCKC